MFRLNDSPSSLRTLWLLFVHSFHQRMILALSYQVSDFKTNFELWWFNMSFIFVESILHFESKHFFCCFFFFLKVISYQIYPTVVLYLYTNCFCKIVMAQKKGTLIINAADKFLNLIQPWRWIKNHTNYTYSYNGFVLFHCVFNPCVFTFNQIKFILSRKLVTIANWSLLFPVCVSFISNPIQVH